MKIPTLHASWQGALGAEFEKPYFQKLSAFVDKERAAGQVFPPEDEVFTALQHTPLDAVRVVILGQDPYHDVGQAHGLSFSVKPGVASPPSLMNMYKELKADLGCKIPNNGYLLPWADQGVLMLNAVLTVKAHTPNSHKDQGWEQFTDAVVRAINDRAAPAVFLLWGAYAKKKGKVIDRKRHAVLEGAHPSPLSAKLWFGSRPFSQANAALAAQGHAPINWQIPDL